MDLLSSLSSLTMNALFAQLVLGLVNGAFYAILSLGLAIIFGLLNVVNFAHGALYMMGALLAWIGAVQFGLSYWQALMLVPTIVGCVGFLIERLILRPLNGVDHLYGLLATFGLTLVIEGLFTLFYGSSTQSYDVPHALAGGFAFGGLYMPKYRIWVIAVALVVCLATWLVIERTRLGSYLRAATENPNLVRTFGINVTAIVTMTYVVGVALAGFAGVLAVPIYGANPTMGTSLIVVVFAIVVIGGLGSILGAIVSGFALGVLEGLTKAIYPEASNTIIFVAMIVVLWLRPAGLFGAEASALPHGGIGRSLPKDPTTQPVVLACVAIAGVIAPFLFYPMFLVKLLCFALFACGFNILIGYVGLASFGHALYFGAGAYIAAFLLKHVPLPPELALLAATLAAVGLGVVFGGLAIRRKGIYFSMVTLAFAQMVYFYAVRAPWTGAEDGIQGGPRGSFLGNAFPIESDLATYFVVLAISAMALAAIYHLLHSPFGRTMKAVRENEAKALSLGYDVDRCKWIAFIISAGFAGLAGATQAWAFQIASLSDLNWQLSGEVILMTLCGGVGTFLGPLFGAIFVTSLEHFLSSVGQLVLIIQGVVFVLVVLALRDGFVGEIASRFATRRGVKEGLIKAVPSRLH